jgi:hypothetical protein
MANSITKSPAAPFELIPSYHLQTITPRIHRLPLLLLLELRPHADPVGSHKENLQKGVFGLLKMKSFPMIQIAQITTQTPTLI